MQANHYFKKGQSLIEVGIFSVIILMVVGVLVSYGISFNHNQRIQMIAFKKAMRLADEVKSTYRQASIFLIYDKAIADIASMWGISQRAPISVSASGVNSNELYADLEGEDYEIPRMVFDINRKVYSLKTAAFVPGSGKGLKRQYIEDWDGTGICWEEVECEDEDGSCDVDGDDKEETILKDEDGDPTGTVLDYQEGELDMTEDDPNKRSGLIADTKTVLVNRSALTNTQTGGNITTRTRLDYVEIVERRIRLNPQYTGNMTNINDNISNPANNPGCDYSSGFSCSVVREDCDCILTEADEKFVLVRSKFSSDRDAYNWTNQE